MSEWYKVEDQEDVGLSKDGKMIQICFDANYNGNVWVEIPIEFLKDLKLDKAIEKLDESN